MTRVEITRLGAKKDRKHLGAVGDVVDVDDDLAKTLFSYAWAKPADEAKPKPDDKPGENPANDRETATDDERETRALVTQS